MSTTFEQSQSPAIPLWKRLLNRRIIAPFLSGALVASPVAYKIGQNSTGREVQLQPKDTTPSLDGNPANRMSVYEDPGTTVLADIKGEIPRYEHWDILCVVHRVTNSAGNVNTQSMYPPDATDYRISAKDINGNTIVGYIPANLGQYVVGISPDCFSGVTQHGR